MDLDYKRRPAELFDSLDARGHGNKRCHWALLLELGAAYSFRSFVGRYSMGSSLVRNEIYTRPGQIRNRSE